MVDILLNNKEFFTTEEYANLLIKVIVSVLVIVFIAYIYVSWRTNSFIKTLKNSRAENVHQTINNMNDRINNKKYMWKSVYDKKWNQYYFYYNQSDDFIPDPYEYFKREDLVYKVGQRKFVETIPAMLVSLGILGTFIGIFLGIQDLQGGSSEQIQIGINTLLEGMDVAFMSSIVGILGSLAFQIIDRLLFYPLLLLKKIDKLRDSLDEVIPVESEGSLLQNLVETQKEQMNDLKEFFTDEFINRLTSGITESFNQSIQPHLEQTQQTMQELVEKTTEKQHESMDQMVDNFIDSLNETTNNHMDNILEAFGKSIEWQEHVHSRMEILVENVMKAAENQSEMVEETKGLTNTLNQFTDSYANYQENLFDLSNKLESTSSSFDSILERMDTVLHSLGERYTEVEDQLKARIDEMNQSIELFKDQSNMLTQVQSDIQSTASSLHGMTNQLAEQGESLRKQHEVTNQWSDKTQSLLEDVVEQAQVQEQSTSHLNEILNKVMEERERIENIRGSYEEILENNVQDLKRQWEANSLAMNHSNENIERLNNSLDSSIESFAEQMHQGIQFTFEQFDRELQQAVQYLATGVDGLRDIVESMDKDLSGINTYISSLKETVETTSNSQS
ncbi:hypothetical protein E3U55_15740 [Filobacillus milosensis]|uniref:MotA/TolQ/ExbB proton channel domain-containing protein n=1 Tax=Filobacillus milosensis TaxID=94137 RepID=A0A4Y8IFI5_9BACI|nr:anti-phage ZorAB system protein ZorA [Filobacillus milosensis]TFB13571.1 hypothetical protein E3U55_15740 [Filobacillus milosensis]